MRIRGSIDRVDFNSAHNRVRVSDYKTGAEPPKAGEIIIGRGAELQRVLYALAARQLAADNPQVVARLVFLDADRPKPYRLPDVDEAIAEISGHIRAAVHLLRRGIALPGPEAHEDWNDFHWRCRWRRPSIFRAKERHSVAPSVTSRGFGTRDDEARRRS
jgi:PD-(D/E)XK nuclease superfamily